LRIAVKSQLTPISSTFQIPKIRRRLCAAALVWTVAMITASPHANAQNTRPASHQEGSGATNRALLVGINTYQAKGQKVVAPKDSDRGSHGPSRWDLPVWENLEGSVDDAQAMRELLASPKFGFSAQNMHLLTEAQANRKDLLAAMQKYLVEEPQKGDVVVFYYAGHGSQRVNTKNGRPNHLDETIVPSDANTGVFDIRNKEVARIFNRAIDKGIILTAVFDSCHSGGVARGIPAGSPGKLRFLAYDPRDAADPPDRDASGQPVPRPEERPGGALVLSAAQQDQLASEWTVDEVPHGAFTIALLDSLRMLPANAPAEQVFGRVKVLMQGMGLNAQQPAIDGPPDRLRSSLFGNSRGPEKLTVAMRAGGSRSDSTIELDGGHELGLSPGCELLRIKTKPEDPEVRVRITSSSLGSSKAEIVAPATRAQVEPGDEFELDKWVAPEFGLLSVWIPPTLESAESSAVATTVTNLRDAREITWVGDPVAQDPDDACRTNFLQWSGSSWTLLVRKAAASGDCPTESDRVDLGKSPSTKEIAAKIATAGGRPRLFLDVPPSPGLALQLRGRLKEGNSSVALIDSPETARYLLVGRQGANSLEYAWVQKDISVNAKRIHDGTGDGTLCSADSPYPPRTDWFSGESTEQASAKLADYAGRLARVYGWLNLPAPTSGSEAVFPYRLELRAAGTKGPNAAAGQATEGQDYGLELVATGEIPESFLPKWVYVLGISCDGSGNLLYPVSGQNNFQPKLQGHNWPKEIDLTGTAEAITIEKPFGLDSYVLLTTSNQLSDLSVFSFEGALSRGAPLDPLARLFWRASSGGTRGIGTKAPADWSVQYLHVLSVSKQQSQASTPK
jgi:hypothetical protein